MIARIQGRQKESIKRRAYLQTSWLCREGMVPSDTRQPWDMRGVLERVLDGSRFDEFKKLYGSTLITGFGSICSQTVGIVANDGILFSESALKGKESSAHAQLLVMLT